MSRFDDWKLLLSYLLLVGNFVHSIVSIEDAEYYRAEGHASIRFSENIKKNEGIARNVILFVGDGMGVATISAGRIFKGQQKGKTGEEGYLVFEKFENVGLFKTYNVDRQVPDSAATATAMFSGVKANYYTLGFDATAKFNTCQSDVETKAKVDSILTWALEAGKFAGIATTTRITHATPAASYAHCTHRDWECDTKIPESERNKGCKDIARQLVEDAPGRNLNVILGGGEQVLRAEVNETSTICTRGDGKDLIQDWVKFQEGKGRNYKVVKDRLSLRQVGKETTNLLGIFAPSHIPYDRDRYGNGGDHPSLADMTEAGIKVMREHSNGFVFIIEGGRIDHAHHDNLAQIALEEVMALDEAIQRAMNLTHPEETLILVTADHSHSFTINGYPKRGSPIEGVGDVTPEGFHYQTLSYINGPGYNTYRLPVNNLTKNQSSDSSHTWMNLTNVAINRTTAHHAGFWMDSATHNGEDVSGYATGPMAHLIHGVHEQTHIAYTIGYAACIGPYENDCKRRPPPEKHDPPGKKPSSGSGELLQAGVVLQVLVSVAVLLHPTF